MTTEKEALTNEFDRKMAKALQDLEESRETCAKAVELTGSRLACRVVAWTNGNVSALAPKSLTIGRRISATARGSKMEGSGLVPSSPGPPLAGRLGRPHGWAGNGLAVPLGCTSRCTRKGVG